MPRRSIKTEKTPKKIKLGVTIEKQDKRPKPLMRDGGGKSASGRKMENTNRQTDGAKRIVSFSEYEKRDFDKPATGKNEKRTDREGQGEERKKELIMWAGVGVSMFLVIGIWLQSTKQVFETARAKNASQPSAIDGLRKASEEIGKQIEAAKQQADELAASSTEATSTAMIDTEVSSGTIGVLPTNGMAGTSD